MVREGEIVEVVKIMGGDEVRKRLAEMGLYEGAKVEVVKNDVHGPIILKIFERSLALGRGQAMKIMTKVSQND
jgi:Fe2+ transport system protein FeoA